MKTKLLKKVRSVCRIVYNENSIINVFIDNPKSREWTHLYSCKTVNQAAAYAIRAALGKRFNRTYKTPEERKNKRNKYLYG